ncbi:pyridoxal-phosphate dependent enzyme [Klebsiella variicola subsp. variicola]|nr:pyridoxal-phosphate dependent enzyme [Klebsiella variicola subsp. variicola]
MNPSGSVKDRAAKRWYWTGIARGLLTPDKTIIDATSGNTGIAYAMIGAALGITFGCISAEYQPGA